MLQTFEATLQPMLMLFICIAIGFALRKCNILPDSASTVMAKLETWVFCPALSFITMARFCTVQSLTTNVTNVIIGFISVAIALTVSILLSRVFVPEKCYERGVYQYALAFGNFGYVGDPVILALFGDSVLSYYKLFTLPYSLVVYVWGLSILVPNNGIRSNPLMKTMNPPTIAMLAGMIVGLSGLGAAGGFIDSNLPFLFSTLDALKGCMGPVAMLLAGCTIAKYDFIAMLQKKKVYIATFLRLIVLPVFIIGCLYGIKELGNSLFSLKIPNDVLYLAFFAIAAPLGLNTVVFPEAYGGNPETGASMAMISHTLCILTIPLMYAVIILVFGAPLW